MSYLTKKEYLDLIQTFVDQQYDDLEGGHEVVEMEWIPSEPAAKEKIKEASVNGTIDLTNVKSGKIKSELFKCTNLKIGKFKLRLNRYFTAPSKDGESVCISLEAFEERHKTPNGHPCKMDFPMLFAKDSRFENRPWLKYFNKNHATNVPIDIVVEIVRWMQAVQRMTAFL
jgi:hypothetical protein